MMSYNVCFLSKKTHTPKEKSLCLSVQSPDVMHVVQKHLYRENYDQQLNV